MTPDESSLPALRGVGFTISRNDRAEQMVNRLDNAVLHDKDVTNKDPADLFAEDVTRGYRVDVEPNGKPFLSLCPADRNVRDPHAGRRSTGPPAPRRGVPQGGVHDVRSPATTRSCTSTKPSARGAAGASSRSDPADSVMPDESLDDGSNPMFRTRACRSSPSSTRHAGNTASPALRLRVPVPRPRRRPRGQQRGGGGHRSLARQRAETFLRWEPVPSPAVIPRLPFTEGESLMRMVIRSTLDVTTVDYVRAATRREPAGSQWSARVPRRERAVDRATEDVAADGRVPRQCSTRRSASSQAQASGRHRVRPRRSESGTFMQPVPGAVVVNPGGATRRPT